ncbi:MAG TPA: phosphotransferase, partial [Ramlibacter sp.]|nr:phosphotransferase [Ramlibacter sp.]
LRDVEATGRGLALLHEAARDYRGPPSLYALELPFLLDAPLQQLCAASTVDDALRTGFTALAERLRTRFAAVPLGRVACHGDCHGGNNFMSDGADGERIPSFFDFDDAGPGWRAYDLAIYLWAMFPRKPDAALDEAGLERWRRYLAGYSSVREIAAADLAAIAPFMAVRQFWMLGEFAGRVAEWGTQALPTSWLRKQLEFASAWETMETPQ